MIFSSPNAAQRTAKWWLPFIITVVVLWIATGLRFYEIAEQSFWNDEGNSARLSERSLPLIIEGTASDIHPPLYYVMLRGWRELLGEDEFGLRAFSAFAGVLTVAATLSLAILLFKKNTWRDTPVFPALLAAFLAAINPALIYYSRETRMYALLSLLGAVSTIVLIRWLNAQRRRYWAALYITLAAAGLYTHYFFPAILLLQNLIVAIWALRYIAQVMFAPFQFRFNYSLRRTLLSWVGMILIILLLYTPWLPIFLRQVGGRPGQKESFLAYILESLSWMIFGETISSRELFWPVVAALVLGGLAVIAARGRSVIPVLGSFLPIVTMYAVGATQPTFFKFLLTAVPFFVILLGRGMDQRRGENKNRLWLALPILSLALVLSGSAYSLQNLYDNPAYARADYRAMAAQIATDAHPNAGVILVAPNQWEVFTYYHREGAPVYPLPKSQADPEILVPQLESIIKAHDRLYALYWGEQQRDPQRIVERWLDNHIFKSSEEWVGDVRFVVYAVPKKPVTAIETVANLRFANQIILDGYTILAEDVMPGDIVQVTLFWHAEQEIAQRLKVFLHVVSEDGALVAQRDSEPGGGQEITSGWSKGETVTDNHGILLPPELPRGEYKIVMGLYDIQNPDNRLPIQVNGTVQDSWSLGTINVK
ncbi:MAG: glycosyltransferase family 39 protein [Candidatus Promineifilaceae bacterium]|nr:glycosyltransferase family 39 protein [Candidatus Promineifilaceae bacterium]